MPYLDAVPRPPSEHRGGRPAPHGEHYHQPQGIPFRGPRRTRTSDPSLSAKRSDRLSYRPVTRFIRPSDEDYRNGARRPYSIPGRLRSAPPSAWARPAGPQLPIGQRDPTTAHQIGGEVVDKRPAVAIAARSTMFTRPMQCRAAEDGSAGHQPAAGAAGAGQQVADVAVQLAPHAHTAQHQIQERHRDHPHEEQRPRQHQRHLQRVLHGSMRRISHAGPHRTPPAR